MCGLKESAEGQELTQYLEEIFTGCLETDVDITIRIISAYWIRLFRKRRTLKINIKFRDWCTMQSVLSVFREQQGLETEGEWVSIYPDLNIITIQKRKNLKFLTAVLA